ncbi:hypothetical protein BDY24DRAFT_367705 [Mrakia frigida]|uniref:uncharacterized protein n=1 Tax=Mrakia frigida TaxID=29902 RepID=UPI003FCBFB30
MSGLYSGHLPEYPRIRVDHFSGQREPIPLPKAFVKPNGPLFFPTASLYLLSHCHTDHTQGLEGVSGGVQIICTQETKDIILNLESAANRKKKDRKEIPRAEKMYGQLKRGTVDALRVHPYNEPFTATLCSSPLQVVTITLLPANHCPGSAMFLIEGENGTVLHTGDIRCEGSWMKQMLGPGGGLERYGGWWDEEGNEGKPDVWDRKGKGKQKFKKERIQAVYVDSSAMLGTGDMMLKDDAARGMLDVISLYPEDTKFFINAWTWGYEELLLGISSTFPEDKIHLDRYKRSIYKLLPSVEKVLHVPHGPDARFHACDLENRCEQVGWTKDTSDSSWKTKSGGLVVNINPAELRIAHWDVYRDDLEKKISSARDGKGPWPTNIVIPLARHSPLPELRDLLYSLRPLTVYPNTLISKNSYPIEYLSLPFIFPALPPSTLSRLTSDISSWCQANFPDGGEVAAWQGVKDWMVKGAAKTPLGDTKEEFFVGGIEALKGVERGVVDAVGRAKMIGEGASGLRELGWDELGEVDGWVGTMGGRGKLERVVGMVLRVCNAGNGDEELEKKVEAEEEGLSWLHRRADDLSESIPPREQPSPRPIASTSDLVEEDDNDADLVAAKLLSLQRPSTVPCSTPSQVVLPTQTPTRATSTPRSVSSSNTSITSSAKRKLTRLERELTPGQGEVYEDQEMEEWIKEANSTFDFDTPEDLDDSMSKVAPSPFGESRSLVVVSSVPLKL